LILGLKQIRTNLEQASLFIERTRESLSNFALPDLIEAHKALILAQNELDTLIQDLRDKLGVILE